MDNFLTDLYRKFFEYLNAEKELNEQLQLPQEKGSNRIEIIKLKLSITQAVIRDLADIISGYLSTTYTKNKN